MHFLCAHTHLLNHKQDKVSRSTIKQLRDLEDETILIARRSSQEMKGT
jgi:hypothetical protein